MGQLPNKKAGTIKCSGQIAEKELFLFGDDRLFRRAILFGNNGFDDQLGCRHENSFVLFQKLFDIRFAADGVGNANGVMLTEFVMNEKFADHVHLKIRLRHAPNLTVSQRFHFRARSGFGLNHNEFCKFNLNISS